MEASTEVLKIIAPGQLLDWYRQDSVFQVIASEVSRSKKRARIGGLKGSLDAVVAAAIYTISPRPMLFIMNDKEEAAYFHYDLQQLIGGKEIHLFPSSFKKPYQIEETENANIMMRAEVLNNLSHPKSNNDLVVTYPEALTEKVINRRTLTKNTWTAKVGEEIDISFIEELLLEYDFEKSDFVYEAGQFSVRGGIIDIFSFAADLPFRIELFGDEIERISEYHTTTGELTRDLETIAIYPAKHFIASATPCTACSGFKAGTLIPVSAVTWVAGPPKSKQMTGRPAAIPSKQVSPPESCRLG